MGLLKGCVLVRDKLLALVMGLMGSLGLHP